MAQTHLPITPGQASALAAFNDGVRAMQQGDEATAGAKWEEACQLDPSLVPAWHNRVVYHANRGDDAKVVEMYQALVGLNPYDTKSIVRLAGALRRIGRFDEAASWYQRAVKLYPYYRLWYYEAAENLEEAGRLGEAEQWRENAGTLDADEAEMAFEDGAMHLRQRNYPLAIACLQAVLEDLPGNLDARLHLARAYAGQGNPDLALEAFGHALEHAGLAGPLVHYQRARLLVAMGRHGEAQTDVEFALDQDPEFGLARALAQRLGLVLDDPGSLSDTGFTTNRSTEVRDNDKTTAGGGVGGGAGIVPVMDAPDPTWAWTEQVRQLVRQAALLPGPTGKPPRLAVVIERTAVVRAMVPTVMELLETPELSRLPGGVQPVFVVEGEHAAGAGFDGIARAGWLGTERYPHVDTGKWDESVDGLPIDRLLAAVSREGGADGFNLVLILGTGRVRSDQTATIGHLRQLRTYQIAMVHPPNPVGDLSLRLNGTAPNWVEIGARRV